MKNPQSVLDEVKIIVFRIFPEYDFKILEEVFNDILRLFSGKYPGYRRCNTEYHNLKHTTDVLLAMTRLIHGAVLRKKIFYQNNVTLGLISALMHDTGFIQASGDVSGTGAKYMLVHVQRSIDFMDKYFREKNFSKEDFEICRNAILCTDLGTEINEIHFKSRQGELLGKMLGTADLLGQMAAREYLEKLPFLFYEFREGDVPGCPTEMELLKKTSSFFMLTRKRLASDLGGVNKYLIYHFKSRWNINMDLYKLAIKKYQDYFEYILKNFPKEYRQYFRREKIVKKLKERGL